MKLVEKALEKITQGKETPIVAAFRLAIYRKDNH